MLNLKFWTKYFEVDDVLRKIELTPFFKEQNQRIGGKASQKGRGRLN